MSQYTWVYCDQRQGSWARWVHWGRAGRAGRRAAAGAGARGRHGLAGAGLAGGAGGRQQARAARACRRWTRGAGGSRRAVGCGKARQGAATRGRRSAWELGARAGPVGCSCTRLGFQPGFSTRNFS